MSATTYYGDPAVLVELEDYDATGFVRRLADLVPSWHRDAACAGEPLRACVVA